MCRYPISKHRAVASCWPRGHQNLGTLVTWLISHLKIKALVRDFYSVFFMWAKCCCWFMPNKTKTWASLLLRSKIWASGLTMCLCPVMVYIPTPQTGRFFGVKLSASYEFTLSNWLVKPQSKMSHSPQRFTSYVKIKLPKLRWYWIIG